MGARHEPTRRQQPPVDEAGPVTAVRSRAGRSIDPRLQARRRAVARRDGLRRLWVVAGLTLVASLAVGAIAVANSSWLDIESVRVVGAERSNPQELVTASGIRIGEPLVEIDTDGSARAVERVPWVAEAEIDRSWGGAVTIAVSERVAIVAVPTGLRAAMVDRTGRQLEVVPDRPAGFIPVVGVEASGVPGQPVGDEAMPVVSLVEVLTPAVADLTAAVLSVDGQLMIELTIGGRVNFGDDRDLHEKLVALETLLARVELDCLDVVDVRVPAAPTITRTAPTAESEEPLAGAGGC